MDALECLRLQLRLEGKDIVRKSLLRQVEFVPGRNENDPVTFFAGFSYDGPRAWDVKPA